MTPRTDHDLRRTQPDRRELDRYRRRGDRGPCHHRDDVAEVLAATFGVKLLPESVLRRLRAGRAA